MVPPSATVAPTSAVVPPPMIGSHVSALVHPTIAVAMHAAIIVAVHPTIVGTVGTHVSDVMHRGVSMHVTIAGTRILRDCRAREGQQSDCG